MTLLRGTAGAALSLLLLAPSAPAAWNNVFQVTCHGCRRPSTSAYVAVPAPTTCCAPPQVAYVQRSYYQPVTTYEPVTQMVPVTSNYTSYYWEPVRSYTYSSYYDPCSCSCQSVATPVTSYRLRSQCNAVTNYVARISYRPVTTMRQSCYMEAVPVNPCGQMVVPSPLVAAPAPTIGVPPLNLQSPEPALNEQRSAPGGSGSPALSEDRSFYGGTMPPLTGQSLRQPAPRAPTPPPAPVVPAKPGQIAARPNASAVVNGQVVANNLAPRGGAKVVFVSAQKQEVRQAAQADGTGRFQVNLPAGGWYVYLTGADGQATYHSQLTVQPSESRNVTVVSR